MAWVRSQPMTEKGDSPGILSYPRQAFCVACGELRMVWMDEGIREHQGVTQSANPRCRICVENGRHGAHP